MIKLIASDIDGTLVKDGTLAIDREYMEVIGRLIDKGIVFVACGAGKINMERMVKSIWPFLLAEVIILLLMVIFPAIVTVPMNFFLG